MRSRSPTSTPIQLVCLACCVALSSTTVLAAELEELVGRWKTPGGSVVEVELDEAGQVQARLLELSAGSQRSGFSVGDEALRNIVVTGDSYSFEIAFRQDSEPHTLTWLPCTTARLDRGTLVGEATQGQFNESNEFVPDETPQPYWLVPRCPTLEGPLALGTMGGAEITIDLREPLAMDPARLAPGAPPDPRAREGFCRLEATGTAATSLQTGDIAGGNGSFRLSPRLAGCDIEVYWKEYTDAREASGIVECTLGWTDDETGSLEVFRKWGIGFKVYAFAATFMVGDDRSVSMNDAFLDLQMDVDGPAQTLGPFYLSGDLSSLITYRWSDSGAETTSWTEGTWSFGAMANVQLEMRRGGWDPIASMSLALNEQGEVQGVLMLNAEQNWSSSGYEVTLRSCTVEALVSLKDGTFQVLGGGIAGELTAGQPIDGTLGFTLEWRDDIFRMAVASTSDLRAFGGKLTNLNLAADLNPDTLEFRKIEGAVTYEHGPAGGTPDLVVSIDGFTLEDGKLTRFLGSGQTSYKSFALNVRRLSYDATVQPAVIEVAAALNLGWSSAGAAAADLKDFRIDANGVISSFSIEANLNSSPVEVSFAAAFRDDEFSGRFRGKFGGAAEFGGTVVIGSRPQFNYGALSIYFNVPRGVPIGQTGLKLLGLNGAFGCNYNPDGSPLGAPFGARQGIYYIQAGLTIGDVGGLASLNGTVSLYLGNAQAVGISGTLQVTAQSPYFRGTLTCNYVLGSGALSGSIRSSVHIPLSGSVVSINDNALNYRVGNGTWNLDGSALGGQFFSFLTLSNGRINLHNRLDGSISSMTGSLSGRLSGRAGARWAYPSDFRCSSEQYDFGVAANFAAEVSGDLSANLNRSGTTGSFGVRIALSGNGSLRLRSGWFGFDCASVGLSASGRLNASNTNGNLAVSGTLRFSDSSGWISRDLSYSGVF